MKVLIIQTAFIGDVILATPIIEKIHQYYQEATIHFLCRRGNESLLKNHPYLDDVLVFEKKGKKYRNLLRLLRQIRKESYDYVINVQRFASSGFLTALSGAEHKIGFDKNPFSRLFTHRIKHVIEQEGHPTHEVERNLSLIHHLTDQEFIGPKLYPTQVDFERVKRNAPYVCIAPASKWFTKQFPKEKWIELIDALEEHLVVCLIGGPDDRALCEEISAQSTKSNIEVLAGQLSFLESAALIKNAEMNYVNDSAPLHLASAVDAPTIAIFCSTIPEFGFGPLSTRSKVVETQHRLDCRPCGLHGKKACPLGHFKCADISIAGIIAGANSLKA